MSAYMVCGRYSLFIGTDRNLLGPRTVLLSHGISVRIKSSSFNLFVYLVEAGYICLHHSLNKDVQEHSPTYPQQDEINRRLGDRGFTPPFLGF